MPNKFDIFMQIVTLPITVIGYVFGCIVASFKFGFKKGMEIFD